MRFLLIPLTICAASALCAGCGPEDEQQDGGITIPDGAGACGPSNCPVGCCQGGSCMPGTSTAACGGGGLPCVQCQQGKVCAQAHCIQASGKCNPSNCPTGCCKGDTCSPGTSKDACGSGGNPCIACGTSQKCENQSCGCGPGTCNGCCEGGVCRSGIDATACGTGGKTCSKCTSSQICLNGACTASGGCSSSTCNGCCAGSSCKKGDEDAYCGQGGQACQTCKSTETCTQGICVDSSKCGPSSCSGCCSGAQCLSGLSSTACGSSGNPCKTCTSQQLCTAGACKLDPTSQWGVIIGEAQISTSKSWDTGFYTEPDAYAELSVGSTKGTSTVKNNTYTPKWDEYLFTATAGAITSTAGMKLIIYDDDVWPLSDEVIGACTVQVSDAVLASGSGVLSGCGSSGYITKLTFKFTAK